MAAPAKPNKISAFGTEKWVFTPTLILASPSVATLTGGSALDVSCFFLDTTAEPALNQGAIELPRFLCETQTFETPDVAKWNGGDMIYGIEPQAAPGSNGKKAYEKFAPGTTGFLVERLGIDAVGVDLAVGQFVNAYPVTLGQNHIGKSSNGPDGITIVTQKFFISAAPAENVALVA